MLRRILFGSALAGATLAGGTLAQAASKHHFSVTPAESVISQSPNYPKPGSTVLRAGIVTGTFGDGAIVEKIHITSNPTPTTVTFKGSATAFYSLGTFKSALTGTTTLQSDGSVSLRGHAQYTSGTGAYRGAHGRYSFAGTIPAPMPNRSGPAIAHVCGTVSY